MDLVRTLPPTWADALRALPYDWEELLRSLPPRWLQVKKGPMSKRVQVGSIHVTRHKHSHTCSEMWPRTFLLCMHASTWYIAQHPVTRERLAPSCLLFVTDPAPVT
jgi:hypothetical protein